MLPYYPTINSSTRGRQLTVGNREVPRAADSKFAVCTRDADENINLRGKGPQQTSVMIGRPALGGWSVTVGAASTAL